MRIKQIHTVAVIFFVLALVFYFIANSVAITFGILGMVSEFIAWSVWLSKEKENSDSPS